MTSKKLVVFLGSVRDGRNVSRVWNLTSAVLKETGFDVTLIGMPESLIFSPKHSFLVHGHENEGFRAIEISKYLCVKG
jgi:hypothetical protein